MSDALQEERSARRVQRAIERMVKPPRPKIKYRDPSNDARAYQEWLKQLERYRVYFVQGESTKNIKIGLSLSVEKRVKALQAGSPDKLILLHVIKGTKEDENDLHKKFAKHRLHGEWFSPAPELLGYIEKLKK